DFLDVDHHPTITFRSTRIEQVGDDHWKVAGALTILDATRPVVLDVQRGTVHGSRADAHAAVTIDRRDFGMTYAGFAVGKEVTITIDAVALKRGSDAPAMRPKRGLEEYHDPFHDDRRSTAFLPGRSPGRVHRCRGDH